MGMLYICKNVKLVMRVHLRKELQSLTLGEVLASFLGLLARKGLSVPGIS